MRLTSVILTALAGTALAAPSAELETRATSNMMAAGQTWTSPISSMSACNYKSTGNSASHASYSNAKCGPYTVGSTWSNQLGNDEAFTTLSVVIGKQTVYPAYTDKQLAGNKVLIPDQSYTPANLS